MIRALRTNSQLRDEVAYLQSRLKAATDRPVLVVKPGPPPGPAADDVEPARPVEEHPRVRELLDRITALERMRTTAGAVELVRDARTWQERAEGLAELEAKHRRLVEDQEHEILQLRAAVVGSVPGPRRPGLG